MLHRLVHSPYIKEACAQCTLTTTATNEIGPTTDFHCGSHSESTCVTANADRFFAHLNKDDTFVSDKGYRLENLAGRYGLRHIRPTEMMGLENGMTQSEAVRSRRVAQVRIVTERMVLQFKFFDIFDGKPVKASEWKHLDTYKDVVTWLIYLRGPLPDHLTPTGSGSGSGAGKTHLRDLHPEAILA